MELTFLGMINFKKCIEFPNKRRYATRQDAKRALITFSEIVPTKYIYYCRSCAGWHLATIKDN